MRDNILNVLSNSDKALDIFELQDLLEISTVEETSMLSDELRKLEDEVILYHTNKDKYMLLEKSHLRKGIMRANKKGFGFVEIENMEDDVYISQDNMNGAIHDDVVLVEITSKMNIDRMEGRILKIIERRVQRFIGLISFDKKGIGHVDLDDSKIKLDIEVPREKSLNAVGTNHSTRIATNSCCFPSILFHFEKHIVHHDDNFRIHYFGAEKIVFYFYLFPDC